MRDYKSEYRKAEDKGIAKYGRTEWNRIKRARCNAYEKTKKGYVMRMYRNMKSRVTGVQKAKFHLYEGLELMSKEDFYNLALNDKVFDQLFKEYEDSGYEMSLAPSPDRVDSQRGYTPDNIDFVTHSVNSRNGSFSRHGTI